MNPDKLDGSCGVTCLVESCVFLDRMLEGQDLV